MNCPDRFNEGLLRKIVARMNHRSSPTTWPIRLGLFREVIQTLLATEEEAAAMNGKIHTDKITAVQRPRAASPVREYL